MLVALVVQVISPVNEQMGLVALVLPGPRIKGALFILTDEDMSLTLNVGDASCCSSQRGPGLLGQGRSARERLPR